MESNQLLYCYIFVPTLLLSAANFGMPCLARSPRNLATDELALLALKASFSSDPSGIITANWSSSTSVCSWVGVRCGLLHRRVAALNISGMGITSTIPPHLGNLSFLVSLDLGYNYFTGIIPTELSSLHRLKLFSIQVNNLTGLIPSWFGILPELEDLNLRNNSFTGFIPSSISNLSNIASLDFSYNSLHGSVAQELGSLIRLRRLLLDGNHLTGPIPVSIFNLSTLEVLRLGANELNGGLPTDMCHNLPFIETIGLSNNQLSGRIPANLSECSRLQAMSLMSNQFSGQIPREIGMLNSVQLLYLSYNDLDGVIPEEIGNLQNLVAFTIENCKIFGAIPPNMFNITSMQYLYLQNNRLSGNIPREIGNLTMLQYLYLRDNYLTGVLPREIGKLGQLVVLSAGTNNFTDSIILPEVFNISTLEDLELASIRLGGTLPVSLGSGLPGLVNLDLVDNNLHGSIPDSIANCSQLRVISLFSNKFTGSIPHSLGNLRLLERLYLSFNDLTNEPSSPELSFFASLTNCKLLSTLQVAENPLDGTIPASVGNLSSYLENFWASGCKIKGGIPTHIGNLSNLLLLSLERNQLTGVVPVSLKQLGNLQGLYLSNNNLRGPIPDILCDLPSLVILDLRGNRFSGPIPQCLGNATLLQQLLLTSNKLTSSIPSSIWHHRRLLILELGSNSLGEYLPPEISNLASAIHINLSMNQFSGPIPSTIGELMNLADLLLAHNKFQGSIPTSMGSMINLETLDLSYNNLSGPIPMSLEKLQHLKHFNVSFNALTGEIPTYGPFTNFTQYSFMGNGALCGIERFHVSHCHRKKRVSILLFILLGVTGFIIVASTTIFFKIRNKRRKGSAAAEANHLLLQGPARISYYELLQATEEFSESNLLGVGGFGSVYKGTLEDGKVFAVKVFNLQLEAALTSFDIECEVLRNIRHRNLIQVISSCSNNEFRALVLEYMPNGSLERWLYSQKSHLDMMQRLNIMIDIALALEYLHHGYSTPIIHCDLKPSNVLLDEEMTAHVSDFGIAKLLSEEESIVHTNTLATLGYIAPEYGMEGLVSTACDIYSYGIILMETYTGRSPRDNMFNGDLSLTSWVNGLLVESPDQVIDANLLLHPHDRNKNMCYVSKVLELSLKCAAEHPGDRLNAKEIIVELQKIKRQFLS